MGGGPAATLYCSKTDDLLSLFDGCHCAGNTNLQLPNWYQLKGLLRSNGPPNLATLRLPYNSLEGPMGPLAYYLPNLRALDLTGNSMHGFLPNLTAEFPGLLQRLELAHNNLQGEQECMLSYACQQPAFMPPCTVHLESVVAWGCATHNLDITGQKLRCHMILIIAC